MVWFQRKSLTLIINPRSSLIYLKMDQDRQGFVEFVEHVHPMRSVYTQIAKTGRGLYTKLNMERGKHFNDLCKNMQGVLNMIAQGKIKVNKDESESSGLRRYDRDLCRALKNRRKFRERVKSMKTGPQMSRSIAKLANKALAHREELKEQGRWKPFLEGQDLRHIPVKVKSSPRGRGRGKSSPQQDHQVMDNQEPMEDSSEEQETASW